MLNAGDGLEHENITISQHIINMLPMFTMQLYNFSIPEDVGIASTVGSVIATGKINKM